MTICNPIPTDIGEYISYDPETGVCRWKKRSSNCAKIGGVIACKQHGYCKVHYKGIVYKLHRVIWYLHYGKDPMEMMIDHRNGVRDDNRISNLRLVSPSENQHNRNSKGRGITYVKRSHKWQAKIQIDGKRILLGTYDCPLMAGLAYQDAKKLHHPTAVR